MFFQISETIANQDPPLIKVVAEIDAILNDATRDATLSPERIARQSGLNINRIESALEIYVEHGVTRLVEVYECPKENCQQQIALSDYEQAIEEDGACYCLNCNEKLDGEELESINLYSFRVEILDRIESQTESTETTTNHAGSSMDLNDKEISVVKDLLEQCLRSMDDVENVLGDTETGRKIRDNVDTSGNLRTARRTIREEAERQGLVPDLLIDLIDEVPAKQKLLLNAATYIRERLEQESDHLAKRIDGLLIQDLALEETKFVNEQSSLEGVVSRDPFIDLGELRDWCGKAERRICRIRLGKTKDDEKGTGFLIGNDLVLTCYHVVDKSINDPGKIEVYFDDTSESISVGSSWKIPFSKYSDADLKSGTGEPKSNELDYAVLKLAKKVDASRGHFQLDQYRTPNRGEPIIIAGHPGPNAPLQDLMFSMAAPGFEKLNANETRMIYKTSTEHGSSGSPVFDRRFRLIGLHHNGGEELSDDRFINNRGIPIDKVVDDLGNPDWLAPCT